MCYFFQKLFFYFLNLNYASFLVDVNNICYICITIKENYG